MHFDAACQRVLLALAVAAGRTDSRGGPYPEPDLAGRSRAQARPDGLPDCLNHERFGGRNSERRLLASKKWSGHDADTFEMDRGGPRNSPISARPTISNGRSFRAPRR